jgi:hypothetical protein
LSKARFPGASPIPVSRWPANPSQPDPEACQPRLPVNCVSAVTNSVCRLRQGPARPADAEGRVSTHLDRRAARGAAGDEFHFFLKVLKSIEIFTRCFSRLSDPATEMPGAECSVNCRSRSPGWLSLDRGSFPGANLSKVYGLPRVFEIPLCEGKVWDAPGMGRPSRHDRRATFLTLSEPDSKRRQGSRRSLRLDHGRQHAAKASAFRSDRTAKNAPCLFRSGFGRLVLLPN